MRGLVVLSVAVLLVGCGQGSLLTTRKPPDETRVVDGPSLAVPPDFSLRPPTQGEDYEAALRAQTTRDAQTILVGGVVENQGTEGGEGWLLNQAGSSDANIRAQLEAEGKSPEAKEKPPLWKRLWSKDE